MSFPSPANAGEKWLYVSSIWDGSGSPIYSNYGNILGNTVSANQNAVNRLLGYAYAQGYTGIFLYDMFRYMSGPAFTTNGKNILRVFIPQAHAMGIDVGGVTSTSLNSLNAFIDYNNTCTNSNQKFDCLVTENEWWWWSYNDTSQGPCGEYAFTQMKNTLNSRKTALTAAGLELYAYVGWCRDVGYSYTGTYNCASGSAVRNGSTVTGSCEIDQLVGIVDKFMFHDYVSTPNFGYMNSRLQQVTLPIDVLWIVSSESTFSANWFEGKNSSGTPCCPVKGIEDAYDYISHNLGLTSPAQTGSPISYDSTTDPGIQANINVIGITNFTYQKMNDNSHQLASKNGPTIWVNAGNDSTTSVFPSTLALSGSYLDDRLPIGTSYTTTWSYSGPAGGTFTSNGSLTPTFNYTLPGIYTIRLTVSDTSSSNFDELTFTVTGSVSVALSAVINVTVNEFCPNDCGAELQCVPTGGTGPYTFLWTGGNTSDTQQSVCNGDTFTCTVTDSLGATAVATRTYSSVLPATGLTLSSIPCSVFGASDGSITVQGTGADGNYQYSRNAGASWQPGSLTTGSHTYTLLPAGNYTILVRPTNTLCTASGNISVTQPAQVPLVVITNVIKPACNTASNTGGIDISVSGGTGPYTYLWSNAATTQDLTNIYSGSYTVTVTDSLGAIGTATIIVGVSSPRTTATVGNISCYGGNDGRITLELSGGTPGYSVIWPTIGQTGTIITNLTAGNYPFTVIDANGCAYSSSATVLEPTQIVITPTYSNPSSSGASDGSINLSVTGGTVTPSGYTYSWSNGDTTQNITGLSQGSYTVSVTDDNGCGVTLTIYLFAQDYLLVATLRSKCCLADLVYKYGKLQSINPEKAICLKSKIMYLTLAVCLLDRYYSGNSCIDSEELANLIENLNTVCGCCDCDWNDKLFEDTL